MNKLKMFVFVLLLGLVGLFVGKVDASQYFTSTSSGVLISSDTTGTFDVVKVCVGTAPIGNSDRHLVLISSVPLVINQGGTVFPATYFSSTRGQRIAPAIPLYSSSQTAVGFNANSQCVDFSDGQGGGITVGEESGNNGSGLTGHIIGADVLPNAQEWSVYLVPTPDKRRYR